MTVKGQPIKIERGIPIPDNPRTGFIQRVMDQMQPGDSIVIKKTSHSAAYGYAKRKHCKLVISSLPEHAPAGSIRVWLRERLSHGKAAA